MSFDNLVNQINDLAETQLFQSNNNMNQAFADKLGLSLNDTFAYVYGLLNSREYQEKYTNDLKKDLARVPIVKDKEAVRCRGESPHGLTPQLRGSTSL